MFGLSTTEILIILAVALIFVGPDQLPKVARQIGKGVRQVRGAVGKVDDEMRRAVREAAAEFDDDGNRIEPRTTDASGGVPATVPLTAAPRPGDALPGVAPDPAHAPPTGPGPERTAASAPPITHATPIERDWSQVGKTRANGTVARPVAAAAPGRPTPEHPTPERPMIDPPPPIADGAPDPGPRAT